MPEYILLHKIHIVKSTMYKFDLYNEYLNIYKLCVSENMNWNDDKSVCVRFAVSTFKCICTKRDSQTEANTNENVKKHAYRYDIIWKCLAFGIQMLCY